VRDGPFCVQKCPDTKYSDNGDCKHCHYNCVYGCSGPNNTIGPSGCKSCDNALIVENVVVSLLLILKKTLKFGMFLILNICILNEYFIFVGTLSQKE
jgi:L1 cell adhesion molecule